jgi:peroxiredoxin
VERFTRRDPPVEALKASRTAVSSAAATTGFEIEPDDATVTLEGSEAADFSLESTTGGEVSLEETLESGPTIVLVNRGHWCSFCAEQLATFSRVYEDLRFNEGVDVLPVVTSELPKLVEMRDRFDYRFQLLADPDGDIAEQYSGTEQTSHGLTGVAGTYVVDTDGVVQYEQVADDPADRTYGNWVRYYLRNDFADPFGE